MSKQKTKKFRGSRTCGGGTHKNRRGAGNRGGRGDVGACKHHFVRSLKRGFIYGKHGFKRPPEVVVEKTTVNVGELDETIEQLAKEGFAEKQDNVYHIDLAAMGIDKVLGGGKVTKTLIIKAGEFSDLAKAKIEESQGKTITEL